MEKQALREMTFQHVLDNANVADCPIVFEGTIAECNEYARGRQFIWKHNARMLFGGFWYLKPEAGVHDGYCLMPDIAPKRSKRTPCKLVLS